MSIVNLVLQGNSIKTCIRRFSVDGSCDVISGMWPLINDFYDGQAYNITEEGCNEALAYLDGLSYPHGSAEDITPEVGIVAWLAAEDARGRAGIESKSDIYTRMLVDFPGTTCIQAI